MIYDYEDFIGVRQGILQISGLPAKAPPTVAATMVQRPDRGPALPIH